MRSVLKVSLFLLLTLYLCGRLTLLIHEFLGHGLPVVALGHKVIHVTVQYFGDAWIQYRYFEDYNSYHTTVILVGGVVSEFLIAAILFFTSRYFKSDYTRFCILFLAAILVIHGLHYSILGLYFEYGDGKYLTPIIGKDLAMNLAWMLLIPIGLFSFFFSYKYAKTLTFLFPQKPLLKLGLSSALAIICHLSLTYCEQQILIPKSHPIAKTQKKIFTPQHVTDIQVELKQKEHLQLNQKQKQEIVAKHTPFNLKLILYPLILMSMLVGYIFSKDPPLILQLENLRLKKLGIMTVLMLSFLYMTNLIF